MRNISRFKNSIRASNVYSLAFMLTFALAAGLTTYEEAAAQPSITLSIQDMDATEVMEDATGTTPVNVIATLESMLQSDATVTLSLSGSAVRKAGDDENDYDITSPEDLSFMITAGQVTGQIRLEIDPFEDDVFEGNREIVINGSATTLINSVTTVLIVESDVTFTILDDDFDILLSVTNPEDGTITESSDTLSVTVQGAFDTDRITVLGAPVTVSLNVASDARYRVVGSPSLEISAGQSAGTGTVMLVVRDDSSYSSNQSITIGGTSGGYSVQGTTLTLADDDAMPAALALSVDRNELREQGGAQRVTVTATIVGNATFTAEQMVALTFDPAGTDDTYSIAQEDPTITISPRRSSGSVVLTIEPDPNEVYGENIMITVDGSIGDVIAADAVSDAMVTILNDDFDGSIVVAPSTLSEGDDEREVMVTVTLPPLTQNLARTVTLVVNSGDFVGTAAAADYTADNDNPTEIVVGSGETTETVTLKFDPVDDAGYEGDETILIGGTISGLNLKPATITLQDGDAEPTVALAITAPDPAEVAEGENVNPLTITATLSGMTTLLSDATVTLSLSGDATQMAGTDANDYSVSGDLTFDIPAGFSTASTSGLSIDTEEDNLFEGNESIVISGTVMADLAGGQKNLVVTSDDLALTIVDDDFDIALLITSPDPATVTESSDTLSVTVQGMFDGDRITVLGNPVTVSLNVASDARYTVVGSPMLEISAGQSTGTGTVMLVVQDDDSYSPNQSISIEGVSAGYSVQSTTLMLADDDPQPTDISLSVDKSQLTEEGGAQRVTVTATIVGNATFTAESMVALTVLGNPVAGEETFSVAEEDPEITIGSGMSSGSTVLTIDPANNRVFGANIVITVDGSLGAITAANVADATITILNDDYDGEITVAPSTLAEGDDEREVMVTVTLPHSSQDADRTVTLAVNSGDFVGTAVAADYTADNDNPTEIVVGSGETTETVTLKFDPVDDAGYEGNETILIGGTITGLNLEPATITLQDGDAKPTVALAITAPDPAEVAEGENVNPLTITATLSGMTTLLADATVTLSLSGDATQMAGTDANDYSVSGDLTFDIPAGFSTASTSGLSIDTEEDNVFEGNESIVISGTVTTVIGGETKTLEVTSDDLALTIVDDDFDIALTITEPMGGTISESSDTLSVTVQGAFVTGRITVLGNPVTVSLNVASDDRYTVLGSPMLEISAGQMSGTGTVMLVVQDDESYSPSQSIAIGGTATGYSVQSTTLKLTDDDSAPTNVRLTVDRTELLEQGGAQRVTVTATIIGDATYASESMVALSLTSDPEAGADTYSVAEEEPMIAIGTGMSTGSTVLTIEPANNEVFGAPIAITVGGTIEGITASTATVTILNDDFDGDIVVAPSTLSEGDEEREVMVTVTLPRSADPMARTVTLLVNTGAFTGSAAAITDYVVADDNPTEIEVAAGMRTETVTLKFDPVDDAGFEGDETIIIGGTTTDNLNLNPATITLLDGEVEPTVTLAITTPDPAQLDEDADSTPVTVTATLSGMTTLLADATITLTLSGTATQASGDDENDYAAVTAESLTDNIDAGQPSGTVTFNIDPANDTLFEGNEEIVITGTVTAMLGGVATNLEVESDVSLTIVDDDFDIMLTVTNPTDGMITESSDTLSVTVQGEFSSGRITVLGNPVMVSLDVAADDRYRVVGSPSLEISAGQMNGTGTVMLVVENDDSHTPNQTIAIGGTSSAGYSVEATSVVLVDDDTAPTNARLTVDRTELLEQGGAQRVTVTATIIGENTFTAESMVELSLTSDPEAGADTYSVAEEEPAITIGPAGSSGTMVLTISPAPNDIHNEDIAIAIAGTLSGVTVAGATVTIVNDDFDGVLTVSPSMLSENDGEKEVTVTVTLPPSSIDADRTVQLTMGVGTTLASPTTASPDYAIDSDNPVSIVVESGETTASVTLKIDPIDDGLFEGDETIEIRGEIANLDIKSAKIQLRDVQRATITLTADVDEIPEAGGQPVEVTVTASQSTKISSATVVTLAQEGTATKGVDYLVTAGDGEITIAAGATEGETVLTIMPVDDLMFEGGQTIVVSGTTAEDNVVNSTDPITLVDNNAVPLLSITVEPEMISESDGATEVTITAILAGTSGEDIEIGLAKPGVAEIGVDFTVSVEEDAPAFVISASDTMAVKTVTIIPMEDMLYEGDEVINVTATPMLDGEAIADGEAVDDIILINVDPVPMITLSVDPATISEGGGAQDVTVTATAVAVSSIDVPITLGDRSDDALLDVDHTVGDPVGEITIAAGELTATGTGDHHAGYGWAL